MTPTAIAFLIGAILIVWGGLVASILLLRARPERTEYPVGGEHETRDDAGPAERDT
ncbi:MAG: methionine/alanine import family NSS transporter small subunit [Microcella sp.]|uniref:methionine/alanine import family NSS transporter small subunit n=1 Tax=Microcella sp. TaxID=1913979 RepID=UPI002726C181|nr:methionine/alanine import family NSS transporter small subunit [Microcella sp.]MDO8338780.1 methionine/alanine import family NSS transporter small subunit [Microcella sp.]